MHFIARSMSRKSRYKCPSQKIHMFHVPWNIKLLYLSPKSAATIYTYDLQQAYPPITIWLCFKTDTSPSNKFQIVEWIYQLKEASVRDANATPPTIGTKVAMTSGFGTCLASESGLILVNYPREELWSHNVESLHNKYCQKEPSSTEEFQSISHHPLKICQFPNWLFWRTKIQTSHIFICRGVELSTSQVTWSKKCNTYTRKDTV